MDNVLLAVGTGKGLFLARSSDGRRSWQLDGPHFPMNAIYAIAVDQRGDKPRLLVSAESEHWGPSVFHSDDLGTTWQEPDRGAVRFPEDADASLTRVWQLEPTGPPGVVWAGAEPASLFRSEDGGATFSLVRGLWDHPHRPQWEPGGGGQCLHTILGHPTEPQRLIVGISTGGVYRTDNGGETWNASNTGIKARHLPDPDAEFGQCVHKIDAHPDRPDQLFLQNHGGVYRSDDGGRTWNDIGDGLPTDFGFPIVADPGEPGVAYVFPLVADAHRIPPDARCRVYRTSDAGDTWDALTEGLPEEPVYFTVLRDAMCADGTDPTGLYFGTRSGEVYGSADAGQSWTTVARHLPEVLCVRAAVLS